MNYMNPYPPSFSRSVYAAPQTIASPEELQIVAPPTVVAETVRTKNSSGCVVASVVITAIIIALVVWLVVVLVNRSKSGCLSGCGARSYKTKSVPSDAVVEVESEEHLQSLLQTSHLTILMHAHWCGHCKNMMPHFLEAGAEVSQKATDVKFALITEGMNADFFKAASQAVGLRGFPTTVYAKKGGTGIASLKQANVGRDKAALLDFSMQLSAGALE